MKELVLHDQATIFHEISRQLVMEIERALRETIGDETQVDYRARVMCVRRVGETYEDYLLDNVPKLRVHDVEWEAGRATQLIERFE